MGRWKVVVPYPQLITKVSKCIIVELFSIVRDKDPRDPKPTYDTFLEEAMDILLRDGCQWFCFYPFGEVVNPYN